MSQASPGVPKDLEAIRHPVRGKSHRPVYGAPWGVVPNERGEVTVCGVSAQNLTGRILAKHAAPEDLCRRCFPGGVIDA